MFLYISFFPQLVAGPIVRASDFLPQLKTEPRLDRSMVANGIVLILIGLFKKMVIADYLATSSSTGCSSTPPPSPVLTCCSALYGYAVQIYCDFSGYSDIAIGVAGLLGYHFPAEFRPALSLGLVARVLAALAHLAVELAARLSLHAARRQPSRHGQDLPQPR